MQINVDRFELLKAPCLRGREPADIAYWLADVGGLNTPPLHILGLLELIEDVITGADTRLDIVSPEPFASGEFALPSAAYCHVRFVCTDALRSASWTDATDSSGKV